MGHFAGGRATVAPRGRRLPALVLVAVLLLATLGVVDPAGGVAGTNEPSPSFVQYIGTRGSTPPAPGDLLRPSAVAVAPNGDVYVADAEADRVVHYDPDGAFVGSWGEDPGPGQLDDPRGLAVAATGHVYVLDHGNSRVQRFTAVGQFVSMWGSAGSGDGEFDQPLAIAAGPDGHVWVSDSSCRVERFTADGVFVSGFGACTFGANGMQADAIAVAADGTLYLGGHDHIRQVAATGGPWLLTIPGGAEGLSFGADGNLFAVSGSTVRHLTPAGQVITTWSTAGDGDFRSATDIGVGPSGDAYVAKEGSVNPSIPEPELVQRFTATGSFVAGWGLQGDGLARFLDPEDVAATPDGGLVVADTGNQRIVRLGQDRAHENTWGGPGSGPGEFDDPRSVAVADGGDVYVADTGNHRVQRFDAGGQFLAQWGSSGTGPGQFGAPVGVDIDSSGDVWVVESSRVQRFDDDGGFELEFGSAGTGPGQFQGAAAIAVGDEGVFVADADNDRVQRFELDGSFAGQWPTASPLPMRGIAADPQGGVWVVHRANDGNQMVLHRYSADGALLALTHEIGRLSGGVDLDVERHLFVTDQDGDRMAEEVAAPGPLLAVSLTADSASAQVGQVVDYTLIVRNTGDGVLTDLDVAYAASPECDGPVPDLAEGASFTATCSHLVGAADGGSLSNHATVTSTQITPGVQSAEANVAVTYASPLLLGQLGGPGSGLGQLGSPIDLDIGPDGDLFVHNQSTANGDEIDVYDGGQPEGAIDVTAAALVGGLSVGADGDFFLLEDLPYVYDDHFSGFRAQVERFTDAGAPLGVVDGSVRDAPGTGVAARASDGHVLLTTRTETLVHCDGPSCQFLNVGANALVDIDPVAGTGTVRGTDTAVDVASHADRSYTLTGTQVQVRVGSTIQQTFPVGGTAVDLDVNAQGIIFVAFAGSDEIKVFSPTGTLLAQWGAPADRVAVGDDGLVYVLDRPASVVRVFGFGITGVVADEVTDAPLPGVVAIAIDAMGHLAGAAVSDPSGGYRLRVGPGQYRVAFVDPSGDHLGEWAWGQPLSAPTSGASISVGVTGAKVDIGLLPGRGAVAGTVSADGGGALPGAWVAAVDLSTGVVRGTVAGGDGSYELAGLAPGDQLVAFVDPSGQRRFEFFDDELFANTSEPVAVTAGASSVASAGLAAQGPLGSGATIAGTVTSDEDGQPLAGAWVVAIGSDGVMRAGAVADASGQYSMTVGGPGSYRVQVIDPSGVHTSEWANDVAVDDYDGAGVFTVTAGETETVDVGLASNRGSIAGTVTDPTGAAAGAQVVAISLTHGGVAGVATVAGNGTYALGGLLPGDYLVAFFDPTGEHGFEYFDDAGHAGAATPVAVTAAQTTTVDADLA